MADKEIFSPHPKAGRSIGWRRRPGPTVVAAAAAAGEVGAGAPCSARVAVEEVRSVGAAGPDEEADRPLQPPWRSEAESGAELLCDDFPYSNQVT